MLNLQTLELPVLIDLLSEHTATYTKLLADGTRAEEYEALKQLIKILQAEIELRKNTLGDPSVANPEIIIIKESTVLKIPKE